MTIIFQILIGVVSTGIVALFGYYWFHRRLYVVTKYLQYSTLSDSGKTVTITIFNRGVRSEKDIVLELDPARRYTLLASSIPELSVDNNLLTVKRLSGTDDLNAVVLVEGGDFDNDNIVSLISRETKGKIQRRSEDLPPTPAQMPVIILALLVFLAFPLYGLYYTITSGGHPELMLDMISGERAHRAHLLALDGWQGAEKFANSLLGQSYGPGEFPVKFEYVGRKGDFVRYSVTLNNTTTEWLTVSAILSSTAQDAGHVVGADDSLIDQIVPAKTSLVREMSVYLPASPKPRAARTRIDLVTANSSLYALWRMLDVR